MSPAEAQTMKTRIREAKFIAQTLDLPVSIVSGRLATLRGGEGDSKEETIARIRQHRAEQAAEDENAEDPEGWA